MDVKLRAVGLDPDGEVGVQSAGVRPSTGNVGAMPASSRATADWIIPAADARSVRLCPAPSEAHGQPHRWAIGLAPAWDHAHPR
jgi:hypothetical protein